MVADMSQWVATACLIFGLVVLFFEVVGISLPKIDTLASIAGGYGAGYFLSGSWVVGFIVALLFGVVFHFLIYPYFFKATTSTAPSEKSMEGKRAEVTVPIPAGGCGEVMVLGDISKLAFIAEGYNGQAIPLGEEVVIVEVVDGVARVTEISGF